MDKNPKRQGPTPRRKLKTTPPHWSIYPSARMSDEVELHFHSHEDEAHFQRCLMHAMRMLKYEPYKMGLSPKTAEGLAESITRHHIRGDFPDNHDDYTSEFDALVAFYFCQGLSMDMAVAEAEADIDNYTQENMGLSPETAAAFAESMADNTEMQPIRINRKCSN